MDLKLLHRVDADNMNILSMGLIDVVVYQVQQDGKHAAWFSRRNITAVATHPEIFDTHADMIQQLTNFLFYVPVNMAEMNEFIPDTPVGGNA